MRRQALVDEVVIVPMRRRHLPQVLKIEAKVHPRPWSLGIFLSELGLSESRHYFVAVAGRKVIGYCGLMISLNEGHITNLAIDPDFWGIGVGSRLLLNAFQVAKSKGVKDMTLEVRTSNTRAQQLYFRFGFMPVGVRKGYYQENNEDAIIMWSYNIVSSEFEEKLRAIEAVLSSSSHGGEGDQRDA